MYLFLLKMNRSEEYSQILDLIEWSNEMTGKKYNMLFEECKVIKNTLLTGLSSKESMDDLAASSCVGMCKNCFERFVDSLVVHFSGVEFN